MKLYVNGQDIRHIVLGDVQTGQTKTFETETEGYLKAIDMFLDSANTHWKALNGIYAVVGPGSATALRSILSILQTVHFVQGTPLFAVEKEPNEDDAVTIVNARTAKQVETLIPIYLHSPRITISHKDSLGRKC